MKNFKRIASAIAALSLAACVAVPMSATVFTASAAGEYSITINDAKKNHDYKAYQIFAGTLSEDTTGKVLSNITWGSGIKQSTKGTPDPVETKTIYTALSDLGITGEDGKNIFRKYTSTEDATGAELTTAQEVADAVAKLDDNIGKSRTDIDKVAAVFAKYIADTPTSTFTYGDTESNYTASNLEAGYYLVTDAKGEEDFDSPDALSKYLLEVVDDAEATPKASAPEVMKKVKENDSNLGIDTTETFGGKSYTLDAQYNDVADYDINDPIPFKLYGTIPDTIGDYVKYKYVFHDSLDSTLALDDDFIPVVKVKTGAGGVETIIPASGTKDTASHPNYTVKKPAAHDGGVSHTFDINFADILDLYDAEGAKIEITPESIITVEYTAKLTSDAVIGTDGQENDVYLEYSSNPNWDGTGEGETENTPTDTVIVFTYELDGTKYKNAVDNANKLNGAKFALYKDAEGGKVQYAIGTAGTDGKMKITGWTTAQDKSAAVPTEATQVESQTDGTFGFVGLDEGTYYLKETVTPPGYNTMEDMTLKLEAATANGQDYKESGGKANAAAVLTELKLTVDEETPKVSTDTAHGKANFDVINQSGATLPSTGGIGTTLFYLGGGALVAVAGVMLITKKRMTKE